MTDPFSEGKTDPTSIQRDSMEGLEVSSKDQNRSRRYGLVATVAIPTLLVVVSVALLIDHFVIPTSSVNSLSNERQLGLSDAANGNCSSAIPLLTKVVAADSLDFTAKAELGGCYYSLALYGPALSLLKNVASSQPNLSNELALAAAAFNSGNQRIGIAALNSAVTVTDSPSGFLSIAQTAEFYGANSVAIAVLGHTPIEFRTYSWYVADALAELSLGFPDSAVAADLQAVRLVPQSLRGSILVDLGDTYVGVGNYAAAANAYQNALSTHQPIDSSSVYLKLSQAYLQLAQYPATIATTQAGVAVTSGANLYSLEFIEATALADYHRTPQAIRLLRSIVQAKLALTSTVASAKALLSSLGS